MIGRSQQELYVRIFSWITMLVGFIMALFFFRERMLYLDGPHFIIEMINNNGFYTPVARWTGYLIQILPVIGIKAGLEIPQIMFLYSFNISLFYLSAFAALELYYKDHKMAFVLSILQWLTIYETFYMPVSELPMGIAFLLLLIAHLNNRTDAAKVGFYLILLAYLFHIVFSHPLIAFPLVFSMAAALLSDSRLIKKIRSKEFLLWAGLIIILIILRIYLFGPQEAEKIGRIQQFKDSYQNLFMGQPVNYFMRKHLASTYLVSVLLICCCAILLAWKRKFVHLFHLIGFSLLFTFAYMVSHPQYDVRAFTEIYFLCVVFFIAVYTSSLIFDYRTFLLLPFVIVLFIVQSYRTIDFHGFFINRNRIYTEYMNEMGTENIYKAKIPFFITPIHKIGFPLASGYESLLMSLINKHERSMTFTFIMTDSIAPQDTIGTANRLIINEWYERDTAVLNMKLFHLMQEGDYSAFYPQKE